MKLNKISQESMEEIARRLKCLAEPTRLQILQLIMDGEMCVGDIAATLKAGQANISKHLQLLSQCHFVKVRKEGTTVYYGIYDESIVNICNAICSNYERTLKKKINEMKK